MTIERPRASVYLALLMRSSTRTTFSAVLIGTSSLPWTRVSGFCVILTLWAWAAGINQKPETRNQKKNAREGFTCASTSPRCRRFLVSGFWFLVSGFWFLVSGFWFLVSGFWFLVSGFSVHWLSQ